MALEESSYRSTYNYKLLCKIKDKKFKSVCESGDELILSDIVKDVFIDNPSTFKYNFDHNPPNVDGQYGVPTIVDTLLGKSKIKSVTVLYTFLLLEYNNYN